MSTSVVNVIGFIVVSLHSIDDVIWDGSYCFGGTGRTGTFLPAGSRTPLLKASSSDGTQNSSLVLKSGGCNLRIILLLTQGFVYVFGSSIVIVTSSVPLFTRR